jgi:hypothetical protein
MSGDLERRYRRTLRLLPRYYRDTWEEDMTAAFLDSSMTGDPDEDELIAGYGRPGWPEIASVAGLAARLYLGGAGAPRRYFAWGQAVRGAVLTVLLAHAVRGLGQFLVLTRSGHLAGWLPPPAGGFWPALSYAAGYAWIVIFVALVLRDYRIARAIAALTVAADLALVLHGQLAGGLSPFASWSPWASWVLLDLAPVLALAAFHRDAPPVRRRPWLLALPACYLLVAMPLLAAQLTGHSAWVPDTPGLYCVLVALACLAHAICLARVPRGRSSQGRTGTSVRSLTLVLLAAVAGLDRVTSLTAYLGGDPHLVTVSLAELLILAAAAALVAPDATRTRDCTRTPDALPAPPSRPRLESGPR